MALYLLSFLIKRKSFSGLDLTALIFVIIDSIGIIAGINVAIISFGPSSCGQTPVEQIYIFIGGFAVIYVSCKDIWNKYLDIQLKAPALIWSGAFL